MALVLAVVVVMMAAAAGIVLVVVIGQNQNVSFSGMLGITVSLFHYTYKSQ